MALKAITTLDVAGLTQNIVFTNPSQVDEIDFLNNQITLKSISSYDLSKSDFLLYFNYLDIFNTALFLNFPTVNASLNLTLPLCEYDFKVGATRITYDQHSATNDSINLTYFPSTQTMTFGARASDIIISLQEFFAEVYFLRRFTREISLN